MAGTINNTAITTSINEEETIMTRANRVSVKTVEGVYQADFYRTHKHVGTMTSAMTDWQADESMNKTAQREDFRRFAIEHAWEIGVEYDPVDRRNSINVRRPKYEMAVDIEMDVINMLEDDMHDLIQKCPHELPVGRIEVDNITPMTHTSKGTDLSTLGIIEGKYASTGNWAWADIDVTVTFTYDSGETIYFCTKCQLVSGQLKKPHITQTGFNADIKQSLLEAGIIKEEVKEDKKSTKKSKAEAVVEEVPVVEESKPKKTRKSKKQEQAQA